MADSVTTNTERATTPPVTSSPPPSSSGVKLTDRVEIAPKEISQQNPTTQKTAAQAPTKKNDGGGGCKTTTPPQAKVVYTTQTLTHDAEVILKTKLSWVYMMMQTIAKQGHFVYLRSDPCNMKNPDDTFNINKIADINFYIAQESNHNSIEKTKPETKDSATQVPIQPHVFTQLYEGGEIERGKHLPKDKSTWVPHRGWTLVSPNAPDKGSMYLTPCRLQAAHVADFLRKYKVSELVDASVEFLGKELNNPKYQNWVTFSTHGLGVLWLHLRLEQYIVSKRDKDGNLADQPSPKYYHVALDHTKPVLRNLLGPFQMQSKLIEHEKRKKEVFPSKVKEEKAKAPKEEAVETKTEAEAEVTNTKAKVAEVAAAS
ncbi:MAG: hypothetical protein SP4CHLAM5_07280 [Chlamydiia bacterium]|nr:hypothetical protein [Chlamydiia bacterium]MCH9618595.1 hypothetical protein [Chlamydiia bacterium]MCH9623866.1 hypothetical protein [Chlamydiia bacterium]